MSGDEITLNLKTLKAIGAESRVGILKALGERQKTQSELASELKLSKPAVLEHVDKLVQAGLVERIDEGRKWKYYKLTSDGKKLVDRRPLNVIIVLALSLIFALSSALFLWQGFSNFSAPEAQAIYSNKTNAENFQSQEMIATGSSPQAKALSAFPSEDKLENATSANITLTDQTKTASISNLESMVPSMAIFIVSIIVAGFCVGYLMRK